MLKSDENEKFDMSEKKRCRNCEQSSMYVENIYISNNSASMCFIFHNFDCVVQMAALPTQYIDMPASSVYNLLFHVFM